MTQSVRTLQDRTSVGVSQAMKETFVNTVSKIKS